MRDEILGAALMRGADMTQEELFSVRALEERIPKEHPLRKLRAVVDLLLAEWQQLPSDEHFSVDGTLIEAGASMKSFVRQDGTSPRPEDGGRNPTVNFKGETRANDTYASTSDPDARL